MVRIGRSRWLFCLAILPVLGEWTTAALGSSHPARSRPARRASAPPCANAAQWQIRLNQHGFSSGQIDGSLGVSTRRALAAFQETRGRAPTGQPDCATWRALDEGDEKPTLIPYTITADDVKGPFIERVPADMEAAARLPGLQYTSPIEALSERFHAAPAFLKRLNPRARFVAGEQITVPAVTPFNEAARPPHDAAAAGVSVRVSREQSTLRVTRSDGTLVFFAPVSSGSTHDPLPPGSWKVTSVTWRPAFHYNPDLFWDADPKEDAATIKPGPNNPVGVVWIGLDLEHYGLHGTPEPATIGATTSHGCVRLTNWDAARVAALVQPGTPVVFE
jgi:lipoprotein-anchoring transpeptidase ErfK/SrfK